jgi:hypothetical protein
VLRLIRPPAHLASLHLATRQRVEDDRLAVLAARAGEITGPIGS